MVSCPIQTLRINTDHELKHNLSSSVWEVYNSPGKSCEFMISGVEGDTSECMAWRVMYPLKKHKKQYLWHLSWLLEIKLINTEVNAHLNELNKFIGIELQVHVKWWQKPQLSKIFNHVGRFWGKRFCTHINKWLPQSINLYATGHKARRKQAYQ